jgi:hypothetical protein
MSHLTSPDPAEGSRAVIERELRRQDDEAKAGRRDKPYRSGPMHGSEAEGISAAYDRQKDKPDLGMTGPAQPGNGADARDMTNPDGEFEHPAPMPRRPAP